MKPKSPVFEEIPCGALSEHTTQEVLAVIINITKERQIVKNLNNLHCHSKYKIYCVSPGINQLGETIEICNKLNLPVLLLAGEKLPPTDSLLPERQYAATLISAGSDPDSLGSQDVLSHILNDQNAEHFTHIGFQLYRYDPHKLAQLRERFFEDMRLGQLRENIENAEPLMRNSTHFFIDMKSVRSADFPSNTEPMPNGLYGEEICQLARYIGMGQRFKFLAIYGYGTSKGGSNIGNRLIAEVLWHVSEALIVNIPEDPGLETSQKSFNKKIINMGQEGHEIIFLNSPTTGRWWMVIPNIKEDESVYIPSPHSDYLIAHSGEIPMRWLFFYQKINPS